MSAITGPIPPYQNVSIHAEFYQPSRFVISSFSMGTNTTITTTVDHNYVIGQLVRLIIPPQYGCRELNEMQGLVISIPTSSSVITNISSLNVTSYINANLPNKPQILAIGDNNSGYISSTGPIIPSVTIPGAFINISPF